MRHHLSVPTLRIAQDAAADELLGRDPLALLLGMLLDQQFPMERASVRRACSPTGSASRHSPPSRWPQPTPTRW